MDGLWIPRSFRGSPLGSARPAGADRLPHVRSSPARAGRRPWPVQPGKLARPRRQGASGQELARRPPKAKAAARRRVPLRLTRRGRLAITSTVVVLIAAGSMTASMAIAGTARAGAHPGVPPHPAVPAQAAAQAVGRSGVRAVAHGRRVRDTPRARANKPGWRAFCIDARLQLATGAGLFYR